MANEQTRTMWQHLASIVAFFLIFGLALVVVGIVFVCVFTNAPFSLVPTLVCRDENRTKNKDVVIDYTNCIKEDTDNVTCRESVDRSGAPCYCFVPFNVTSDMYGDVIMYYELDTFNESVTARESNYSLSRDNGQLSGNLSVEPSPACEPYAYDVTPDGNQRPIAPCGAIADAMFTDKLDVINDDEYLWTIRSGMLKAEDKKGFHNPDNLIAAFQNFSKPRSWTKNIWELDTDDPENNGFQNEAFIGWMKTEWKRKPMWRLNRTGAYSSGITKGEYKLSVLYSYPPKRYNGTRKAILSTQIYATDKVCDNVKVKEQQSTAAFGVGVAALVVGIMFLILAAGLLIEIKKRKVFRFETASAVATPTAAATPEEDEFL